STHSPLPHLTLSAPSLLPASPPHRALPSFPTRRSSDLVSRTEAAAVAITATLTTNCSPATTSCGATTSSIRTSLTPPGASGTARSEEHTSELQSRVDLVCRLLLEKKKKQTTQTPNTRTT